MTGEALILSAWMVGSTVAGRPALVMPSSISVSASLTSVPNSNWATTSAIELADVERTDSSRGTPAIARSIGLATWSATSAEPAPG